MTDHRAIDMVLELTTNTRGVGFWKMNTLLLQEKQFLEKLGQDIKLSILSSAQKNPSQRWELVKKQIKKSAVEYARKRSSEQKVVISNLSEVVNWYEENLPLTEEDDDLYEKSKIDLEEKVLERTAGVMFRSKAKWYELGEKNTKYFFSLEKEKYNSKTCFKMFNENNIEISEQSEILEQQKRFYQELYQQDDDVSFTIENVFGVEVPDYIRQQQEVRLSAENLREAIKTMSNNKTPGPNGIPIEVYKIFWNQLQESFLQMMEYSFEQSILTPTMRQGILNLIPKPNKDSRYIKNLRPITLLNTDYKIIEKSDRK